MDMQTQAEIKRLAEEHGRDRVIVVLGSPDPESAGIAAETVVDGDPAFAGPLAEAQLGLEVYHVLEDEVRSAIPVEVWEEQIGLMADVLDAEGLAKCVRGYRR
jgi:glycine reductase